MPYNMLKKRFMKIFALVLAVAFISATILSAPVSALISQNIVSWYWTDSTNVSAIATGDVNGDGKAEIVTVGWFL